MGQRLQMTDELHCCCLGLVTCGYRIICSFFNIWKWSVCISGTAVTVNPQHVEFISHGGVVRLQGEPMPVGEDITRRGGGHRAESALWFRPCEGGQLTTKGVAGPPKERSLHPAMDLVLCRVKNSHPVLPGHRSAKGNLTLETHSYLIGWRRCQHWWFHRSQRLMDSQWGGT